MADADCSLRHLPFLEALADLEEASDGWNSISAGLVTLRLFDRWIEDEAATLDPWSLDVVRDAIEAIEPSSVMRSHLRNVIDAMRAAPTHRMALVAPRLMAYGRALQLDSEYVLASDVYRTVLMHAMPARDLDPLIAAILHRGAKLRALAEWSDASADAPLACDTPAMPDDIIDLLETRLTEARLCIERGNFPGADAVMAEAMAGATRSRVARENLARRPSSEIA